MLRREHGPGTFSKGVAAIKLKTIPLILVQLLRFKHLISLLCSIVNKMHNFFLDLQIIAFCFYLRFTQHPNFLRFGLSVHYTTLLC